MILANEEKRGNPEITGILKITNTDEAKQIQ